MRTSVNATYRRLVLLILFAPALRVSSFTHFSTKYMMKTSYCEGDPDGPRSEEPREGGGEYLPIPIDEAWSCCSKLAVGDRLRRGKDHSEADLAFASVGHREMKGSGRKAFRFWETETHNFFVRRRCRRPIDQATFPDSRKETVTHLG